MQIARFSLEVGGTVSFYRGSVSASGIGGSIFASKFGPKDQFCTFLTFL